MADNDLSVESSEGTGQPVDFGQVHTKWKDYVPSGTMKRFHESSKFFRFGAGPVGSGKTASMLCVEDMLGAMRQKVMPDGVRRYKPGMLRDTYRNLYSQYLPSWFEWFPREIGKFVGSDDRPASHHIRIDNAPIFDEKGKIIGHGPCEIFKEMRALGTNNVESITRGWNLSCTEVDELDLMPEAAMSLLSGRAMRWNTRYLVSNGVIGCFNKPDIDHWLYDWCVENPREDLDFFDQPGGLIEGTMETNPLADNIERLPENYYVLQARNAKNSYTTRFIRNKWGASVSGEVVYPSFVPERHILTSEIEPPAGSEIWIGMDGGGTPAAVIKGRLPNGRRITYAEVVLFDPNDPKRQTLAVGVGPKRFANAIKDALFPRFRHCRITCAYGDPSMWYGADREAGEYADVETVGQLLDLAVIPAPSNEIRKRLSAVRDQIDLSLEDGFPAVMYNPSCRWLRRGFVSDYKFEERDPKQEGKELKPRKTATSHVHDAEQYAMLGDIGVAGVTGGPKFDRQRGKLLSRQLMENHLGLARVPDAQSGPSYDTGFNLWDS